MGFLKSMHDERFELIQDDVIESATGSTVRTKKGREVEADVLILSTVSASARVVLVDSFELFLAPGLPSATV